MNAEQHWDKFIEHLNKVQPMKGDDAKHMNFLGSIASYRKIYIEANKEEVREIAPAPEPVVEDQPYPVYTSLFHKMLDNGTVLLSVICTVFVMIMMLVMTLAVKDYRETKACKEMNGVEMSQGGTKLCIKQNSVIEGIYK